MSMAEPLAVFRDPGEGGNVEHLAEHGVTPDEAEQAIGEDSYKALRSILVAHNS
jgi:hypothetical protein